MGMVFALVLVAWTPSDCEKASKEADSIAYFHW